MKKIISLLLVMALTASVAIGGTVAYLTDRDSKANVFTVGDVSIRLDEDFEQGATLTPGFDVKKEATITNTGKNDAWVWMTLAVPAALDSDANLGTGNVLHWNMPGCFWNGYHNQDKYIQSGIKDGYLPEGSTGVDDEDSWINKNESVKETINGVDYKVYTFMYKGAIVPGETTNIALSKVYLDTAVDIDPNGDWYTVKDGVATKLGWNSNTNGAPVIYVSAYAMQKEGFDTVEKAYAAYNTQWDSNGTEYAKVTVATPESGATRPAGYAPAAEGETIDGMIIMDGSDDETNLRALYKNGMTGDLTVKNSVLDGTYAMNVTAEESATAALTCEDTTFMGWTSFSGFDSASFTNCTFRMNSEGTYNYLRSYDAATFENCEFKGTTLDIEGDGTITLINCTMNGELITVSTQLNLEEGATVTISNS